MKTEIHPKVREVMFRDSPTGRLFKILSCVETKESVTVDGAEYPLVKVDVSSASHPFYTGQQRILDTTGRVERFDSKFGGKATLANLLKKKK